MTKISVIIPVYNSEKYLRACLDSVTRQTLREIEIICVDDGSTDSSGEILRAYASRDRRVKIISQKNSGAGAARNAGLALAQGEYLSFLDADDFFAPQMLEEAYANAAENRADVIVFGCDFYDEAGGGYTECTYSIHKKLLPERQPFAGTDVKKDVFKLFVGWAWDKLFRAEFVRANSLHFQEQRTTNDALFVFCGVVRAERIVTLPGSYAHHRRVQGTLSVTREKSWMCFYNMLLALRERLQEWEIYSRFERDYINYCVHFSLWNLNTLCEPTRTLLFNSLRGGWYEELGVTAHGEDYFYNKSEYRSYMNVMQGTDKKIIDGVLRRACVCLREKGLRYTMKKFLQKLKGL